ncbi:Hemerythrin HHE cation binding region [Sterolibacterium denitrificans]|uniref:Hemerythrin HHE cation binding region n=1 Tax=Sterolibacterium denitrificans TaxID=157592 RepID=A0A7Z7HRT7_9PROT|nr:hemerythrin domain-containing protein [Sterolibacterium denitrificans]SMB26034.1 Hemerythrin HHE cation binding region [Sterolibacterium denitrificans]
MRRSPHLLQLSREHHTALVLAKRAQRLARGTAAAAQEFMDELPAVFEHELEPHFQVEEIALLSALRDAQAADGAEDVVSMVERTLLEHAGLRELARRIGGQDFSSLAVFGELLDGHVRFEERELFNRAESLLSPEALARIDEAHRQMGAGCRSTLPS